MANLVIEDALAFENEAQEISQSLGPLYEKVENLEQTLRQRGYEVHQTSEAGNELAALRDLLKGVSAQLNLASSHFQSIASVPPIELCED